MYPRSSHRLATALNSLSVPDGPLHRVATVYSLNPTGTGNDLPYIKAFVNAALPG